MDFEDVEFKNYETKKTIQRLMLKVQMSTSMTFMSTFEDFNYQLKKRNGKKKISNSYKSY